MIFFVEKQLKKIFDRWILKKSKREDAFYKQAAKEFYSLDLVRKKLSEKQYKRHPDKLKILMVYKNHNWEDANLPPALAKFGEVIKYDMNNINPYSLWWQLFGKNKFNRKFLKDLDGLVKKENVNFIFFYTSGLVFTPKTFKRIDALNLPTVNLSLDDHLKFRGYPTPTGWSGNKDICKYITVTVTSYREACEKYLYEGGIPLYLPEGGNQDIFRPIAGVAKDIDVCFVGKNYGIREDVVNFLKNNGVNIQVYGSGWPNGPVSISKLVESYSRSKIAIGFSDSWANENFDIPGRDFEVPLIGPMYLTQYNAKIADYYIPGQEIVLYKDKQDLLEKIRYYLNNDNERENIAKNGRMRALNDHTWEKRFDYIFRILELIY